MIRSLLGVSTADIPFIENEVIAIMHARGPEMTDCDEIIAIGRKHLISWLKSLGNKKMLKRVRTKRHEFYLLLLNHSAKSLKMVPLPREVTGTQIEMAA